MTTTTRPTGPPAPGADAGRTEDDTGVLGVGTSVEVRSRFDRRWSRGFAIDAVDDRTYRLKRMSDGAVLPARFPAEDVRAATGA